MLPDGTVVGIEPDPVSEIETIKYSVAVVLIGASVVADSAATSELDRARASERTVGLSFRQSKFRYGRAHTENGIIKRWKRSPRENLWRS